MTLKENLLRLAKLRRNSNNLAEIQEQVEELRSLFDGMNEALEAAQSLKESITELENADFPDDNPLIPGWFSGVLESATGLLNQIPEDESSLGELIEIAEENAQEYENSLDDKDYSADDREEMWDNLTQALSDISGELS